MAGRPPKPTTLKVLEGNAGKRKLDPELEPQPDPCEGMPAWLAKYPELVAEWNRHAPRLLALGLLTEVDDSALAALCVLEVRLRKIIDAGTNPLDTIKELRAVWSRFGMTPADRARVRVAKPKAPESKLARFRGPA